MTARFCVDSNVFITAWYTSYPPHILSKLWEHIASCRAEIQLIEPVFGEIEPVSSGDHKLPRGRKKEKYPLRVWLEENNFPVPDVSDEVRSTSLILEREYETSSESKGAGEVDITLIAYAKVEKKTVVTFEGRQHQKPAKKSNYKIPLICSEQGVQCDNFIQMLEKLNIRI